MNEEKLIECVRKYEFLYNLQHPKYMDAVKKETAWKEISEEIKQPAAACKQRWQGLRDAYRRALNKRKCKSGQSVKKIKKWKYEDEMSFVTSFFIEKKTLDSFELSNDDVDIQDDSTEVQNPCSGDEIKSIQAFEAATSHDTEIRSNNDSSVGNNIPPQPQLSPIKKKKVIKKQSASAILMSRLLDKQINVSRQCEHDELDRFFLNISETVKKFPPYLQALAKNKTFCLVSEMELQQFAPPSFITTTPHTETASPATSMPTSPWNIKSENVFE